MLTESLIPCSQIVHSKTWLHLPGKNPAISSAVPTATSFCTTTYQGHRFSLMIWDGLLRCFTCKISVSIQHVEQRNHSWQDAQRMWLHGVLPAGLGRKFTHLRGHSSYFISLTSLELPLMMLNRSTRLAMCSLCLFVMFVLCFPSCPGRQVWTRNCLTVCLLAAELQQTLAQR